MPSDESLPRLRSDLVIREQRQADGVIYVVKDPAAGRFFRLREIEGCIARQLDGRTPPDVVLTGTRERFACDLSRESLDRFIGTLRRLGLLEGDVAAGAGPPGRRRVRGSLLYLRFPAFDPDRLLARLAPRLRAFYSPGFVVASALVVLAAFGTTLANRDAIAQDLMGLWRFDALLLAWITVLLVTAIHEFAHGLTCKKFGGEVHEMGFMLIYFQPAFYCNVSDAWLFPERSRRLWVTFSGAYVEIFIWALATLAWRLMTPDTWLSFIALVVMATSGIKCFFNMNPLIKLDGYYLLSDWLGIPNLRARSLAFLGALLRRPFRSGPDARGTWTSRERRIFVLYGLMAGGYSFWLLAYVALWFGSYLTERYRGVGLILFGGFLMSLLRHPLTRLWAGSRAALQAVRTPGGWRRGAAFLASAPMVAGVLALGRMELTIPGDVTTFPYHNADITAEVEGFVDAILVDEGDRVEEGDVIAQLSNRDLVTEREKVDAEIAEKKANLAMRFSQAVSAVDQAEARRAYARRHLGRAETLRAQGLISSQQYDEIEEDAVLRRKEFEEAWIELNTLGSGAIATRSGPGPGEHRGQELARAELERLETRRRHLDEQIHAMTIVSPDSGVVTTPHLKLRDLEGKFVEKGDLIAEVYAFRTVMAEIAISEKDIGEVRPEQKVVVRARAFPGRTFEGRVVSIGAAAIPPDGPEGEAAPAASRGREKQFLVTTALDNPSLLLKPGMTGYAKIYCGRRTLWDLIARALAGYFRLEFWSLW